MLIWLLRHGETVWNAERRYQGVRDIPLSEAGRAKLPPADRVRPETVYVTPLRRTGETAALLFPGAKQVAVDGLREMCFGVFEGRSAAEMADDPAYRAWVDSDCEAQCPGGERQADFTDRVCRAFRETLQTAAEPAVFVVHGGTIMALLSRHGRPARSYWDWLPGNGAGFLLDARRWESEGILDVVEAVDFSRPPPCGRP